MHQYLFYIGNFPIRSYGLVISLSIILAAGTAYYLAKKDGRGYEKYVVDLGIVCGLAGLIGARLWDVFFFDWDYYQHHITELFNVWQGGMAIQGGILLGVTAGIIYAWKHHLDILAMADLFAPAIVLGQSLGRCANLLNGDAFGAPTGTDYGIVYPSTTLAHHVYGAAPLWPAEIWEGQLDLVIFCLLLIFQCKNRAKGETFALYIILYSALRFMLEFLRGDYAAHVMDTMLTSAQLTAAIAFILAAVAFTWFHIRNKMKPKRNKR